MQFVPLTDFRKDHQAALGQIIITMGTLEQQINFLLVQMLYRNSRLAANLTFGCHLDRVLETLKAVFYSKKQPPDAMLIFEYLVHRIRTLNEQRNKNVHCLWHVDDSRKMLTRFKLGKHKKGVLTAPDWVKVDLQELQKLQSEIWELIDQILLFQTIYYRNAKVRLTPDDKGNLLTKKKAVLNLAKKHAAQSK